MDKALLINQDAAEASTLQSLLAPYFKTTIATCPDSLDEASIQTDVIILDSNISDNSGIDVLMSITGKSSASILMITPPNDTQCATESLRIGAANYLVKTSNYMELLPHAIRELLARSRNIDDLKNTIAQLKQRVAELETQLATKKPKKKSGKVGKKRTQLVMEITSILQREQINLPAYPDINIKMNKLLQEQADIEKISELLKSDATISAKLLSVANSSFYKGVNEITSIEDAISRIGLVECRNHVEIISNRAMYIINDVRFRQWLEPLWSHNMACAHTSYILAKKLQLPNPQQFFTQGLLHDIGKLLLLQVLSELCGRKGTGKKIYDEDIDTLTNQYHNSFGKTLLKRWRFPDSYGEIALHHDALDKADKISKPLLVVHLANMIARVMGYGEPVDNKTKLHRLDSARLLRMDNSMIESIQDQLEEIMRNNVLFL